MFRLQTVGIGCRALLRRLTSATVVVLLGAALCASPAAAQTVTIGNGLEASEVLYALCKPCTVFQSAQPGATVTSPVDGSVTSWSYQSGDEGAQYELEILHPTGGGNYTLSARSPAINVPNSESTVKVVPLATALPIKKGDSIGLHVVSNQGVPVAGKANVADEVGEFNTDAPGKALFNTQQQVLVQATVSYTPENPGEVTCGAPCEGRGPGKESAQAPKPPVPALAQVGASPKAGPGLILSAAASQIPAGTTAASYTFQLGAGGAPIKCPGQDPVLNTLVANNVNATATLTVTTAAGASASTSIPISSAIGTLPKVKVRGLFGTAASAHAAGASAHSAAGLQLGQVQALTAECLPAAGNPPAPAKSQSVKGVRVGETGPLIELALSSDCFDSVTVGIIQGVGCFTKVDAEHPLPAAEATILCGHYRFGCSVKDRARFPPSLAEPASASGARAHGAVSSEELAYDGVYFSTQPVRVDGVEIDPVNGGAIVLARAGLVKTGFLKSDSAYLISSDAVVKIAGIPVSLHVPDYAATYSQAKGTAECGKKAAEGVSESHLAATNCLSSVKIPSLPQVEHLIPSLDGPVDLAVSPENLGIELGEFTIPGGAAPIPLVPELPLSGSIKVNLTGLESASLAVHLELPGILSDSSGHGLTGDTTLELSNRHGLQLNYLHVKVPSLAQLGLSRLKNLEFTYSRPTSLFEGKGTLDLNDLINGEVNVAMAFEHGSFKHAHVDYTAPPGGGYPLFGPVFLTYVGADVSLNPTTFAGQANLSIGPAAIAKCGAMGVQGTVTLVFGNPFTIDSTGNVQVLCANFGYSSRFHADSDGHVGFGLGVNYPIPGLGGVSGELYGQAYANFNENVFEAQIDGQVQANFAIKKCESIGPIEECTPTVNFSQSAGATISIGDRNGRAVGGAGVCTHLNFPILGGFDVGAGTNDLPGTILGAASYNIAAVASRFQILLSNCSLTPFRLLPPPAGISRAHGHSAQTPDYTVQVAPGTGTEVIGIQGSGGAPQLTLTGPAGQRVLASAEGISVSRYGLSVRQPSTGQTLIEIPHAAAGSWTLQSAPGSAPLSSVAVARGLPEPKIKARVAGRGAKRVLSYSLTPQPGLTVAFAESVDGGSAPIGTARGARGRIGFAPSLGSGATRTIVAEILRNGRLAASRVVARYAPGAIRPGRPSHILIRHARGGWRISFTPGANTTEHQITIRFADGAQALLVAPRGRRVLTISPAVDPSRPTAVQVVGLRGAARGPAAIVAAALPRRKHR